MKTTGLFVLLIGVAIAGFCGVIYAGGVPGNGTGNINGSTPQDFNYALPFAFAAAAVAVGTFLMIYGKKGYVVTQDPHVHN